MVVGVMKLSRAIVLLIAGSMTTSALTAAVDSPSDGASAKVWVGACAYCHDQGVAPSVFGLGLSPAAIAAVVRGGLNGMPAFHPSELTDIQLQSLADWVARQPTAPAKP